MRFEIKSRDAAGRICNFFTKHGRVETPALMPVINPNKIIISPGEMKRFFDVQMLITNSYIIWKNKDLRRLALKEGVHSLLGFDGPVMTDSGAFQSYVYGEVEVDPVEIVKFQRDIGCDVGTILDVFGTPEESRERAERGVTETIVRARESVRFKGEMGLACPVQGSTYLDLREKCARVLSKIGADFYPIGGVVPLMEKQKYSDLVRVILASKKGLTPGKPVHLFGAGHPLVFPLAVALGCDFFDSAAYVKYAEDNRMIFPWGTVKLEDVYELPCNCPVCSKISASELKKLDVKERVLQIARHNLYVCSAEIKKIKNAIRNGELWELVERRATSNPYLFEALKELTRKTNKKWLERFEPVSKNKGLFYTGPHTIHRPIIYRAHSRLLERYKPVFKKTLVFPEGDKPYSSFYNMWIKDLAGKKINILIDSMIGPVPVELDEMYPFAQFVFPHIVDKETQMETKRVFKAFTKNSEIIYWKEGGTFESLRNVEEGNDDWDLMRLRAVSTVQFGPECQKVLFNGEIDVVKSKKTGKIRNVFCDGKHVLSMRASDGMFTLKIEGGRLLQKAFKYPRLRVVVDHDAVSFVKEGKSVFSKFVLDCDPDLRPLDECLIVDKKDELLGVGRCLLNREEMLSFTYGVAVKTRETTI